MAFGVDDLIIASVIASLAGTAARAVGNQKVRKKQKQMQQQEGERQRGYQQKIDQRVAQAGSEVDVLAQQRMADQGAARRESASPMVAPPSGEYVQGSQDAPEVVKTELARAFLNAIERGRGEMKARSKLGGQRDAQLGTQLALGRSGQDVSRLVDYSRGSGSVLPAELDAANLKGVPYAVGGDILSGLGQLGMVYAMTRPPTTGGSVVGGDLDPGAGGETGLTVPMDERLKLRMPRRLPATRYDPGPGAVYSW